MSTSARQIPIQADHSPIETPSGRGSSTLRRTIKRTLRRVHRQFHSHHPHINHHLPEYLAQSTIPVDTDFALASYFDEYSQGCPSQEHDSSDVVQNVTSNGSLPIRPGVVHAFDEDGKKSQLPTRVATIILARSVFRQTERFSTFGASIVINAGPESKFIEEYIEEIKRRGDLYDQPEREQNADIIARQTWQTLSDAGVGANDIDRTRLLPLRTGTASDLDLLRDLPPFPIERTIDDEGKVVKRRAVSWGKPDPVGSDSFDDDPKTLHQDAEEVFCPLPTCRTFGCVLDPLHFNASDPFDRRKLPASTDAVSRSDLSRPEVCSRSCAKSQAGSDILSPEWPSPEKGKLAELLDAQYDLNSCVLRPAFPAHTCREIHQVILQTQLTRLANPPPVDNPPQPTSSYVGCDCCQKTVRWRCKVNCACEQAGRTCRAEICHPESALGDWDTPSMDQHSGRPKIPCCSNQKPGKDDSKWTRVGISRISGYGVFATENKAAGEYIFDYLGEHVAEDEATNRKLFSDTLGRCYNYNANNECSLVDAQFIGNESRFINTLYGEQEIKPGFNCKASPTVVDGIGHIFITTSAAIEAGQELYLWYGPDFDKFQGPRESPSKMAAIPKAKLGRRR